MYGADFVSFSRRWPRSCSLVALGIAGVMIGAETTLLMPGQVWAADATWTGATSGDWNTGSNWSTGIVPSGNDTATFGTSTRTEISFTQNSIFTSVIGTLKFDPGASAYTFSEATNVNVMLQFAGAGIVNNSSNQQTLNNFFEIRNQGGASTSLGNSIITLNQNGLYWTAGTAGNATITNNSGSMRFDYTGTTTENATITNNQSMYFFAGANAGSSTITNNGAINFYDNSTARNATIINYGSLNFNAYGEAGGNSTAGNATITNFGSINLGSWSQTMGSLTLMGGSVKGTGELTLLSSSSLDLRAGSISEAVGGASALTKTTAGTVTLTGANTYTGGTNISSGTLQIGDGGATGSIAGDVTNNGVFAIKRSDALTFGGVISGSGAVQQNGSGTTTLTGLNTYSGASNVNAGTLKGGATNAFSAKSAFTISSNAFLDLAGYGQTIGSLAGAGIVTNSGVNSPATLTTGGDNSSTTFSGVIRDGKSATSLTKIGNGTLTLSGLNTYTGGTTISGGTLQIGSGGTIGSIVAGSSNVTVSIQSGAALEATARAIMVYDNSSVTNAGTISTKGDGGSGVWIQGNGSTATNSGSISTLGSYSYGLMAFGNSNTLANSGSITTTVTGGGVSPGIYLYGNGNSGNNSGSIYASGFGLFSVGNGNTFTNSGTVKSPGTAVVAFSMNAGETGTFVNQIGGVVTAGPGWYGVSSGQGGTLHVENYGLITGNIFLSGTSDTLLIGKGGSVVGDISTPGTITINRSDAFSYAGAMSGSGSIQQTGGGTTTLTGTNTYTGGTTISSGTLQLGSGGTVGSITGNVTDNGIFAINRSDAYTFGGVISGSGALQQLGTGSTILTGTNTYTGGTTINAGTLQLGSGGTTGSSSGNVNNNGILAFNRSDTFTYGGVISGSGSIQQKGVGTTTLTGANTYTGGTTINAGTLAVAADNNLGNASGVLTFGAYGGGTLQFNGSFTSNRAVSLNYYGTFNTNGNDNTLGGVISGAGLTKTGTGTLTLTGTNTYTGGTVVSAGTLAVGSDANLGGTAGALIFDGAGTLKFTGNFTTSRTVSLNSSDIFDTNGNSSTLSGYIFGFGGLNKTGAGTLALTGYDFHTGGTTISAGTLQIGNGGSAGSINGNVTNNGILALNRSDAYFNYSSIISGSGSVQQNGTGTTTLTGVNTYTGATIINAGTLAITGDISSSTSVTINNGGTLSGAGKVPTVIVNSGGTLAPGGGTTALSGSLTFNNGATYAVGVSPSAVDRTIVSGSASLAGTVQATFATGNYLAKQYTILSSAGLGGTTFSNFSTPNLPTNFTSSLSYTATDVVLNLIAALGQNNGSSSGGLPTNQQGVADTLNKVFNNGGTLSPSFVTLFGLTGPALNNGLAQISGEAGTRGGLQAGTQMMGSFLTLALNPFGGSPGGNPGSIGIGRGFAAEQELSPEAAQAYAAVTPKDGRAQSSAVDRRWGFWGQAYGGLNKTGGDTSTGTHDTTSRSYGVASGADYRVSPDLMLGFALAGGGTNYGLSDGLGGGKSDVFQMGVYGSKQFGSAYVSAALSYAEHWMTTNRTVTVSGTDNLTAGFNAHSFGGRLESGYRFALPVVSITPYAALQMQQFRTSAYSETAASGSNAFALSYDARSTTSTRTELGVWLDKMAALDRDNVLAIRTRAAWAHDHSSDDSVSAAFQTLPGSSFTMNGAAAVPNSALLSAGAEIRLTTGISLGAKFDGEFAKRSRTYAGTGTIRYGW